jgi:hypothetical protein
MCIEISLKRREDFAVYKIMIFYKMKVINALDPQQNNREKWSYLNNLYCLYTIIYATPGRWQIGN